jgi:hypothetical protein
MSAGEIASFAAAYIAGSIVTAFWFGRIDLPALAPLAIAWPITVPMVALVQVAEWAERR